MVTKRTRERIERTLVAAALAVSLAGGIGLIGPAGATETAGAPADAPSAPASAPTAIDPGFAQVENDSENGSRITFEHAGGERASYAVTVGGSIAAGPEADLEDAESVDRVRARRATGSVAEGGTDDFFFTGEITSLTVDGPVVVYIGGERIDPGSIGEGTATDTETAATTTTAAIATATPTAATATTPTATATPLSATRTTETETTRTSMATATPGRTTTTDAATDTETATASPTAMTTTTATTASPSPTRSQATTTSGDGGGSGLSEQERGLFLTIGGVLLLGLVVIAGLALLARR